MTVAAVHNLPHHEGDPAHRLQSQFLAHITHELRTPVHAIIGYVELLTDGTYGPLNDQQRSTLSYLRQSAQDLLSLINNLLDVARIESGRADLMLETFDLRDLIADVCHLLQPLAEAKCLELGSRIEMANPILRTDRAKLKQVLINLLGNAIKFTETGRITIRATTCAGGEVGFYTTRPHVAIAVTDTGCGIPADELRSLFEKFYRCASTPSHTEGTGLGLFITKHLVELLNGKIDIMSSPGRGSTFTVTIPTNYEEVEAIQRLRGCVEQALPGDAQPADRSVLVLSDNPNIGQLLRQALGTAQYTVSVLPAGRSAVQWARQHRPFVILFDAEQSAAEAWGSFYELKNDRTTRDIPTIFLGPNHGDRVGTAVPMTTSLNRYDLLRQVRAATQAGQKRVLIADDDPLFREVLRCALADEGYQLDEATNGAEAIAKMDTAVPDLLLLDLRMPDVDGWAVLQHIAGQPRLKNCRVLIITGDTLRPEETATLEAQTAGVLSKEQFRVQTVLARVAQTLEVNDHA